MTFPKPKREDRIKPKHGMKRSRMKSSIDRELTAWANAVKERDDWRCQKVGCGRGNFLNRRMHAHHIAPRSQRPDLIYDLTNGVTLCPEHHDWVHAHHAEAEALGLYSTRTYEGANQCATPTK